MKIHTQFLKQQNKWSAFTTHNGLDLYELADNELDAIINLLKRLKS